MAVGALFLFHVKNQFTALCVQWMVGHKVGIGFPNLHGARLWFASSHYGVVYSM